MFICNICHFASSSLRAYAHHFRFHRNVNNLNFPCAVKNCLASFSSYRNFVRHVSKQHVGLPTVVEKNQRANATAKLRCSLTLCKEQFSDLLHLIKHLKRHLDNSLSVTCPYKNCGKLFKVKSSFSAHLSRKHNKWTISDLADVREPCGVSDVEVDVEQDDVEVSVANYPGDAGEPEQEVIQDLAEFKLKYVDSIASFYLMLQGKYLVPVSTIGQIVDELTVSHELEQEYSISLLRNTLNLYNIPNQNVDEIVDTLVRDDIFNVTHKSDTGILRSDHMRQKYYREHFHVVDPVQVQLGHDKYNKQATCHYIPIKDTIRALYHNTFVSRQFESPLPRDPGSLSDVMDGTAFQSNAFFSDNPSALKIILFQDAFEIVNPLGSAKKKHKILGVYFTLADFHPHNRSSVAQMQLVMLCRESYCKYFGDDKVFQRLIKDLKDLEENGVDVKPDVTLKAAVVCIAGDNLGSHYIGGFLESFSAEYSCRYCLAKRQAASFGDPLQCCALARTVENHKIAINFLRDNPGETSFEGIKRDSVFNQLTSFHVTTGLPPCIGHDLFEGVICYDLALCLNYFVKAGWFTYEILNGRIQQFEYTGSDAANKPAEVPASGDRLGGQAVQNWTLLRFLPLIIRDKLMNKGDAVWQFVLLMIQMTALICASRLSHAQVAYMKLLIDEYLHARYVLFPDVHLRPKHHYISHYASLTFKFGPLVRLWTMRFESKHSYFKQCIRSAQNFKNVTGMLAERHQLFQAYQLRGNFFRSEVELNSSTAFHEDLHSEEVREAIRGFAFTPDTTVVTDKVNVKGSSFNRSCYVVLSHVNKQTHRTVTANCIMLILVQNGIPFFVARRYQTVFEYDLGVLRVDTTSERVACFAASTIVQDHPLHAYRVGGGLYIVYKSVLFDTAQ